MSSWHSEDWARLGTGFVEWCKAHRTFTMVAIALVLGYILGKVL
jgi:hypothetical protein